MEVKIQIPDNCELIKDGDTYIVKEKKSDNKPKTWEEFCKSYPVKDTEYFIDGNSNIRRSCTFGITSREVSGDKNLCSSKEEAEAFLALMQLRQLRKAWIGDWEQKKIGTAAVILYNINKDKIIVDYDTTWISSPLSFPTQLMAYDFLGCFRNLCETAKILL